MVLDKITVKQAESKKEVETAFKDTGAVRRILFTKPAFLRTAAGALGVLAAVFPAFPLQTAYGSDGESSFLLSIMDKRTEKRISGGAESPVPMNFSSEITIYGRICRNNERSNDLLYTYNDSIRYLTDSPFHFESFMSLDTLMHSADAGPRMADLGYISKYDSMLLCIFSDPALKIEFGKPVGGFGTAPHRDIIPLGPVIQNLKPDCPSGEYDKINMPVSFGAFMIRIPGPELAEGLRWNMKFRLPGFSGTRLYPEIEIAFKSVQAGGQKAVVVMSADTTLKNVRKKMPNGETFIILEDKIHVGGTLIYAKGCDLPSAGELRIEENISLLRPDISSLVGSKECSCILRLTIRGRVP